MYSRSQPWRIKATVSDFMVVVCTVHIHSVRSQDLGPPVMIVMFPIQDARNIMVLGVFENFSGCGISSNTLLIIVF